MACDGIGVAGDTILSENDDKIFKSDNLMVGHIGSSNFNEMLFQSIERFSYNIENHIDFVNAVKLKIKDFKQLISDDGRIDSFNCQYIVCFKNGKYYNVVLSDTERGIYWYEIEGENYAIGYKDEYSMGLMDCGTPVDEAVKMASKKSIYINDNVITKCLKKRQT